MNTRKSTPLILQILISTVIYAQQTSEQQNIVNNNLHSLVRATDLYHQGDLSGAEKVCRSSIAYAKGNSSRKVHILLGQILLDGGLPDKGYLEVGFGWRPGREPKQDLLVALAGSRCSNARWQERGKEALWWFTKEEDQVTKLVGGNDNLAQAKGTVETAATALILLATEETEPPKFRLKFAQQAEQILLKNPAMYYVLGKAYHDNGYYTKAAQVLGWAKVGANKALIGMIETAKAKTQMAIEKFNRE